MDRNCSLSLGCLDRQTYVYWTEDGRWIGVSVVYKRFSSIDTSFSLLLMLCGQCQREGC